MGWYVIINFWFTKILEQDQTNQIIQKIQIGQNTPKSKVRKDIKKATKSLNEVEFSTNNQFSPVLGKPTLKRKNINLQKTF